MKLFVITVSAYGYERIHHLKFKPISFETELLGNRGFESLNPDFRETNRGEIEK